MDSPNSINKDNSKDYQTINSTKNMKRIILDRSPSNSSNYSEKNKILKLLNLDNLKKKNSVNKSSKITETDKNILFSNSRLRNIQILNTDFTLKNLGKSTLDVNRLFGKINIKKKENEEFKKIPNEKFFSFKNEYIIKFAKIAEYFNSFSKYSQLITENRRDNYDEIYKKIKKILKSQTNLFFNDYKVKINKEDLKLEFEDFKSGFYKYKSKKNLELPKLFPTCQEEEGKELRDKNNNKTIEDTELKESKDIILKQNQKIKEGEIRLDSNNKEIENMKSFLNKYEVNSKIFLKIKNEKEIEKIKSIFNKKENEYKLTNFRLKNEINNLTSLLEENQKYFIKSKDLEKMVDLEKKKVEQIKSYYNQELNEKKMENIIKTENEEELSNKIKELENNIEGLKNERDEYKKKDIENKIKINNLLMIINEKKENIKMQNEEVEWFINEYKKLNNNYLDARKDLRNVENLLMTKMKENKKEGDNEKKNENENNEKNDKDKEKEQKDQADDKSEKENYFLENMFKIE